MGAGCIVFSGNGTTEGFSPSADRLFPRLAVGDEAAELFSDSPMLAGLILQACCGAVDQPLPVRFTVPGNPVLTGTGRADDNLPEQEGIGQESILLDGMLFPLSLSSSGSGEGSSAGKSGCLLTYSRAAAAGTTDTTVTKVSPVRRMPDGTIETLADEIRRLEALILLKNTYLRVISHDLRSPFSTVHHYLTLLERMLPGGLPASMEPLTEELSGILSSASQVLENLASVTEDVYGKTRYVEQPLSLEELFAAAVKRTIGLYPDSSRESSSRHGTAQIALEDDVLVLGDREMLVKALRNLLSLGAIMSRQADSLVLGAETGGEQVEVRVLYEGLPVSFRLMQIIDEDRWGAVPDEKTGINSAGLFLFAVRQLLEPHGSRLVPIDGRDGRAGVGFTLRRYRI